jgi:hypothetical protein
LTDEMEISFPGHSDEDPVNLKKLVDAIWYDYKAEASYVSSVKMDYGTVYQGLFLSRCRTTGRLTLKLGDYYHSPEDSKKKYGIAPYQPYTTSLTLKLTKEQEKKLKETLELFASRPTSEALSNL